MFVQTGQEQMPEFIYTMKDLSKVVQPKREILKGIWLSFFHGAKIGVLGLNGSGKSTLLRIMAGVEKEFDGEAFVARFNSVWDNHDLDGIVDDDGREVEVPEFRGHPDFADLMFWNIEHFNNNVGQARIDRVAEVLDGLSMDVMGLVGVQERALERLVVAMRARGQEMAFERGRQDLAVLFDTETSEVRLRADINERHRDALAVRTAGGKSALAVDVAQLRLRHHHAFESVLAHFVSLPFELR